MPLPISRLLLGAAGLLLTACEKEAPTLTIVEGTVLNKYTGQPVAAVPILIDRYTSGSWFGGGYFIDSVAATQTDAAGQYHLAFDASKSGGYEVRLRHPDLYDVHNGSDGHQNAQRGMANHINFDVTPYKQVTLNVRASKGGKTDISFGFVTADPGNWVGGTIFSDTLKANQHFSFSQTFRVVPHRTYRFSKTTCNRYKVPNTYYFDFKDYDHAFVTRTVLYNDTTTINF